MPPLVLATGNSNKIIEIEAMLAPYKLKLHRQTDFFSEEVEEDGLSYFENALKKARYASKRTGLPALADDSGIEIGMLGGRPGIYSARYSEGFKGLPASDTQNNEMLLHELQGVIPSQRVACYVCVMVFVRHGLDPNPVMGVGKWCGEILSQPNTLYGVGYDPIMWFSEYNKTGSEISMELKNKVSHRAKALQSLLRNLRRDDSWSS